jgi:threonine aldolase
VIDLRSDTVTRPSDAMRAAMAAAPVGDDQFGEDPSVNALQERVAALLGQEAAIFVPSGHMANQLALKLFTVPGDDVIVGRETHAVWHETGAGAAISGVQFTEIGTDGRFDAVQLAAAIRPRGHLLQAPTTLVEVENTQNRMGGLVWERPVLDAVVAVAREAGVATYLDGARLLNAAVARGDDPAELGAPFDLVALALSKGLGCPVGSLLAGAQELMAPLRRYRRMLGGALRQSGILAAAGLYALDHHVDRLADDHANARAIAEIVATAPGVLLDPATVETNIVVFRLDGDADAGVPDAATVVARAAANDVAVMAFADRTVRAVTHLDVSAQDGERAAQVLAEAVAAGA